MEAHNVEVVAPPFGVGATGPVTITATRSNPAWTPIIAVELMDAVGNVVHCVVHGEQITTSGAQQTPVALGTEMAIDVSSINDGHIKWIDKRPVASAMRRIIAGPFTPREELDDLDEQLWPADPVSGKPRDPWARTKSVLLKDTETWEQFTFSTSSVGGLNCIGNLVQKIRAGMAKGLTGIPIATLESGSYMHEKYDEVFTPELPITAWKSERELTGGEPDLDSDLNDDVPF